MPCPSPSVSPMLDVAVLQQRIASAAAAVRERKGSPTASKSKEAPSSRVEISSAEKKAARLAKRLNKIRSLLEKVAEGAKGVQEARKKEMGSLNPARRLGRKHSDKVLARLFSRIEQVLQTAQAEKEAPQDSRAPDS